MEVFITGGTGFVGRAILRQANKQSLAIKLLTRTELSLKKLGRLAEKLELIQGDIFSRDALEKGMKGCDAVIHLVGIIKETGNETFEKIHIEGTKCVVDAARSAGIRHFVHMSSENARADAPSRYHTTKYNAEEYLKASGLTYTIMRPSMMFGEEDQNFNELAKIIRSTPITPVIGDGSYIWQPVSVYNVAELFVSVLMQSKAMGKTYEIRGPEKFTFDKILDLLMEVTGKTRPKIHLPVAFMKPLVSLMSIAQSIAPITLEQMKMLLDDREPPPENFSADFPIKLTRFEERLREIRGN